MCIAFLQLTRDAEHLKNRPVDSLRPARPSSQPRAGADVPDDRRKNQ